jgi:hypothetical protein
LLQSGGEKLLVCFSLPIVKDIHNPKLFCKILLKAILSRREKGDMNNRTTKDKEGTSGKRIRRVREDLLHVSGCFLV